MRSNFLLATFRVICRHRTPSVLALLSLVVGITSAAILTIYISFELSFDKFWPNAERIYQVEMSAKTPGRLPYEKAQTPLPFKDALVATFPEIELATHFTASAIFEFEPPSLVHNNENLDLQFIAADQNFFKIFPMAFIEGNRDDALSEPNTIVLTQSTARRLFGNEDPMGKTLFTSYGADYPLKVTGITEDLPQNTHLAADYFIRISLLFGGDTSGLWGFSPVNTYIQLRVGEDIDTLVNRLPEAVKYFVPALLQSRVTFDFEPISIAKIHLHGRRDQTMRPGTDSATIYSFIAIALLILFIASFNFTNYAHAIFSARAREVAVRRICGATGPQLLVQMFGQILMFAFVVIGLSSLVTIVGLPLLNDLSPMTLEFGLYGNPVNILIGGLALLTVIFGPSLLAFTNVLRAGAGMRLRGAGQFVSAKSHLRSLIIFAQFTIAIALIIIVAVTSSQINFLQNKKFGFEIKNLLVLSNVLDQEFQGNFDSIFQRIQDLPEVDMVTRSGLVPGKINRGFIRLWRPEFDANETASEFSYNRVGFDFFKVYGLDLLAGRAFSREFANDIGFAPNRNRPAVSGEANIILNASAAKRFGFLSPAEAVGKPLILWTSDTETRRVRIVGVVVDVPWASPKVLPVPFVYVPAAGPQNFLTVSTISSDLTSLAADIQVIWESTGASAPLDYFLVEDNWSSTYESDRSRGLVYAVFAALAVLLSVVGIYSVTLFEIGQRTREIGIRKVLGGTTALISRYLLFCYAKPVLAANILAWPVAWYLMSNWLQNFVERIDLDPTYFITSGLMALVIALGSIGFQVTRAASQPPVHSLRYE